MTESFDIESFVMSAGFRSLNHYLKTFFLPFFGVSVVAFFLITAYLTEITILFPITILCAGTMFPLLYPLMIRERKKKDIMENLHYFITYAASISYLDVGLNKFFRMLGEKKVYGELSNISDKVLYLAHYWTLGFAKTAHRVSKFIPLEIVANFFDRFGLALDYGDSLNRFLNDEQKAIMADFSTEYTKGLERIRVAKEVFSSLSFLTGYILVISLLVPMLVGISAESVMKGILLFSVCLDIFLLFFIMGFVPGDRIYATTPIRTDTQVKLYIRTAICFAASITLMSLLFVFLDLTLIVTVALGSLPLLYIGFYAKKIDDDIDKKDRLYPEFIRTFAQTLEIKKMDFAATLDAVTVHDFGPMNEILQNIRRRLKVGCDKFVSWDYFCAESGSALITSFNQIFVETTSQGGSPTKISPIISKNFTKVLSLKKLRAQLASGFRGTFYGAVASFTLVSYFAVQLSSSLGSIFTSPYEGLDGPSADFLRSSLGGLLPESFSVNVELLHNYIGLIILFHAFVSAIIMKHIDGGSRIAGVLDFILVAIIGAGISTAIVFFFNKFPLITT